jgi:predicted patatin/cPLA2 family phospholipase
MRALVLEGGAMRGVFAAGVLDGFADLEEPSFDLIVGVSAGACCAASYLAGQRGRNYVLFLDYLASLRFINPWRALLGGSVIDMDYLSGPVTKQLYPLDLDALQAAACRFEVVATEARQGQAHYLTVQGDDCLPALRASVALPLVYRGSPVPFHGHRYFDGALSDPIPLTRALARGATDVTVVMSRPLNWRPSPPTPIQRLVANRGLADYPAIARALRNYDRTARAARVFLDQPAPGKRIRLMCPPADFPVGRFTQNRRLLHQGYTAGRLAAEQGGIDLTAATTTAASAPLRAHN